MRKLIASATIVCGSLMAQDAVAKTNLLILLDASNSMWGQVDGVAKIEIAKTTVGGILEDLPQETDVGLMAYGHRTQGDCADVELLAPIGAGQSATVAGELQGLSPIGKTPIAASLAAGAGAFQGLDGSKSIVLISDGVETCDGDACAAAAALSAEGVDVKVHVVGFDLTEQERQQLECIAENGKGKYFNAGDTEEFAAAVAEAVGVAQEAPVEEPEPIEVVQNETVTDVPVRTSIWVDEFDGFDLSEDWTVNGPNPDNYIVEDDALLAISGKNNGFTQPEAENLFQRLDDLPRGDWDVEFEFTAEFQTQVDMFEFGLMKDAENSLSAILWASWNDICAEFVLELRKMSRGEGTSFKHYLAQSCNAEQIRLAELAAELFATEGAILTLSKRGRGYTATLALGGWNDANGDQILIETNELTSLRSPGKLTFGVGKWNADSDGESLLLVDRIEAFEVE